MSNVMKHKLFHVSAGWLGANAKTCKLLLLVTTLEQRNRKRNTRQMKVENYRHVASGVRLWEIILWKFVCIYCDLNDLLVGLEATN